MSSDQPSILFPDEIFSEPIDPKNICVVFISPRQRAHKTFHLLFGNLPSTPDHVITEECREWDYG
jgi:probable phosphoglycerate mutase